jgi:two-component system, NarL family, nitrate/nitrite response regulator NarL
MIGGNAFGRVTVPRSSVLIVSDVLLYRQGLASTLAHDERLHVVAAVRGDAAVAALHASPARAVLLDMSGPNSLNVARLLRRATPELRIIGFAISDDAAVIQCAEAGLAGFVGCDGSVDEIVAAVEHSLRGELVCSPRQVALLRDRLADLAIERSAEGSSLTRRQREIAWLVADGLSNKEIAIGLRIGPATVKNHVHNILDKLGVKRRSAVAVHLGRVSAAAGEAASGARYTPTEAAL